MAWIEQRLRDLENQRSRQNRMRSSAPSLFDGVWEELNAIIRAIPDDMGVGSSIDTEGDRVVGLNISKFAPTGHKVIVGTRETKLLLALEPPSLQAVRSHRPPPPGAESERRVFYRMMLDSEGEACFRLPDGSAASSQQVAELIMDDLVFGKGSPFELVGQM
jgi:hypothetical protein